MIDRLLVRYGDLVLKGRNKKRFVKTALARIEERIQSDKVTYEPSHDRLYIVLNGEDEKSVITALKHVPGLHSYSRVKKTGKTLEAIKEGALQLAREEILEGETFKVETKRADKTFPMPSTEVSQAVGGYILAHDQTMAANIKNPDQELNVEIRQEGTFIFTRKIPLLGGFPVGSMGKGLVMMSGGIDSPVAAYFALKKGINVELVHFESTPYTSIESVQKVYDLARVLARYGIKQTIRLHLVPFTELHGALMQKVPSPYVITIMRRMMVRITDRLARQDYTPVIINGESVGQVASQTLESIHVTQAVTTMPVLRPLTAFDKGTIMKKAREIGTYAISIRPFEDCCTVYVPDQPVTKPRDFYAKRYEGLFHYEPMIDSALKRIRTIEVTPESTIDFPLRGFTVEEALKEDDDDHIRSE
ncbi:MAG: tRNA uracil 4-sulfurtransferase ThiI [Bacillota bacterium]